ncbi:hypothetical protein JTE90_017945 [Oedothorax gibbosus]|uniref:Cwf19-like C-terminal domain-containing protein n=1 Tax=Oedothorax gibbosus TaxID=931172 RepID=A0AAV6V8Z1_9ARAC|nr:hypothetical protein JTE90_017945 [Oedothorax gibbosus]
MSIIKILVCGDVEGHFKALFSKVAVIQKKKGPFEYLFCVGNFFGDDNTEWKDVKAGRIKVPITTYILGPNKKEHHCYYPETSCDMAPDIVFLGKRGCLTGCSGLKIAYLSGIEQKESSNISFSKKDVTELTNSITDPIDILLTSPWPQGVTKYAKIPESSDPSETGSHLVAYLAKQLKPKYHFAGVSGIYYERLPYRNHQVLQEMSMHTTRFIGLAPVDNEDKLKWLYAFNITPFCSPSSKELSDTAGPVTECPYNIEEIESQFFYDMDASRDRKRSRNDDGNSSKKRQHNPVTEDKCWFCLANPDVEKQLLLSIGEHNYLTLAKGGLVKDHLLILPINHVQASIYLGEEEENELNCYKDALVKYFHDQRKDVVFFERSSASPHLQIQVVPISKSKSSDIKENILEFALKNGIELTELTKYALVKQLVPPKKAFFSIEIWVDKKKKGYFISLKESFHCSLEE